MWDKKHHHIRQEQTHSASGEDESSPLRPLPCGERETHTDTQEHKLSERAFQLGSACSADGNVQEMACSGTRSSFFLSFFVVCPFAPNSHVRACCPVITGHRPDRYLSNSPMSQAHRQTNKQTTINPRCHRESQKVGSTTAQSKCHTRRLTGIWVQIS